MSLTLVDSLQLLDDANRQLTLNTQQQTAQFKQLKLKQLSQTVAQLLPRRAARKLSCPAEYRQQWQALTVDSHANPSRRVLEYLCWEPAIATNPPFLRYLANLTELLTASALQGLVYSHHALWTDSLADNLLILRDFLNAYTGNNHWLIKWRESSDLILTPDAAQTAAQRIYRAQQEPAAFCQEFGLNTQSAFANALILSAADLFFSQADHSEPVKNYFFVSILAGQNLATHDFKSIIERTLLHRLFDDARFHNRLIEFILSDSRLGDPRPLTNAHHWAGIAQPARARILRQFALQDIRFFFEKVVDDESGKERKQFWLPYAPALRQSRLLLTADDSLRLQPILAQNLNQNRHLGTLDGQHSVLVLDFGAALGLEFNNSGSVYIYGAAASQRFFAHLCTNETIIENQLRKPSVCIDRISHTGRWRDKIRNILSRLGIRPV